MHICHSPLSLFLIQNLSVRSLCKDFKLTNQQAQTPEQRMRNARFTKAQDASRGKPEAQRVINKKKDKELKSPVSMGVLCTLFTYFLFSLPDMNMAPPFGIRYYLGYT